MWDAGWYREIARHGYAGLDQDELRFFPLLPLLGHGVGWVLHSTTAALVVVTQLASLGYAAVLTALARREIGGAAARRVPWLALVAPGGIAFVVTYSEPLQGITAAAFLLALRRHGTRSWWAVPAGVLAGLARPTGILLAVPAAIEVLRRRAGRGAALAAVVAPLAGTSAYCIWCGVRFGDALLPFSTQTSSHLRGSVVSDPIRALLRSPHNGYPWWANVAFALVVIAVLVAGFRRLPLSIWTWTVLMALAAVTSTRPLSLARYVTADFGLALALAGWLRSRRATIIAVVVGAITFVAIGVAAMLGKTVL